MKIKKVLLICFLAKFAAASQEKLVAYIWRETENKYFNKDFIKFNDYAKEKSKDNNYLYIMNLIRARVQSCLIEVLKDQNNRSIGAKEDPNRIHADDIGNNPKIGSKSELPKDYKEDPEIEKFISSAIPCDFFKQNSYFDVIKPVSVISIWKSYYNYINEQTLYSINLYLNILHDIMYDKFFGKKEYKNIEKNLAILKRKLVDLKIKEASEIVAMLQNLMLDPGSVLDLSSQLMFLSTIK